MLTGASGYLGSHLARLFSRPSIELYEISRKSVDNKIICDLNDVYAVEQLAANIKPDLVVHCAAFVPKTLSEYEDAESSGANITMLENILCGTNCPIIYISSMTVYGESPSVVRVETDAGRPQSAYGKSKYKCEALLKASGRDSVAIRIPGLFGGTRVSGLIANTMKSILKGEAPNLPSSPLIWAGMAVEDAAECIYKLTHTKACFSGFVPINVAYENVYSINRLVQIFNEIYGVQIRCDVDHPDFAFDLAKLRSYDAAPNLELKSALTAYKNVFRYE